MNAKDIAQWILENFDITGSSNLDDVMLRAISSIGPEVGQLEKYELVEKLVPQTRHYIDAHISWCEKRGVPPRVSWSQLDDRRLIGRAFVSLNATAEERKHLDLMQNLDSIFCSLIELTPNEFEVLCCVALELEGLRDIRRTKPSADRRIDFFGYYAGTGDPKNIWDPGNRKVIGQAKRWKRRVGEPEVDTLYSAMTHLEKRNPKLKGILPDVFISGDELVWGIFAASGEFTRTARESLESPAQRILGRDGQQISMAILENSIGFRGTNEESCFNLSYLREYLDQRKEDFPIY